MLREGFGFLGSTPLILTALSLDFFLTFFGAYRPLLAIYARDILDVGPAGFGVMNSAVALGGMGGSAFVLGVGESRKKGPIQLAATLVYAVSVAAFGLSSWFAISLVICAVLGFCDTVAGIMRRSIIQRMSGTYETEADTWVDAQERWEIEGVDEGAVHFDKPRADEEIILQEY